MSSFPNDGRRAGEADCFQAFASPLPLNYSDLNVKKFVLGIPYKFVFHFKLLHPEQNQILEIISSFEDISPLEPKDKEYVTPLVRGTFVGQDSKFCTFKVTELPDVRLYGGAPHFTVYKDQASSHPSYLEGGDTSKKDKLYDGNNAINQRVTSIMASIDDITGLPSYNDRDAIIQFIFCRAWPGKHATIQYQDLNCMIAILLLYDSNS